MKTVITSQGDILYFDLSSWEFIRDQLGYFVKRDSRGLSYTYVQCTKGSYSGKILARILTNCPDHLFVDHINNNPFDNRLDNLRIVTKQQNAFNMSTHKNKKSGLPKGVRLHKPTGKYKVRVLVDGYEYHIGTFLTVMEAEEAYKKAAEKYFGEYASHINKVT